MSARHTTLESERIESGEQTLVPGVRRACPGLDPGSRPATASNGP